MFEVWWTITEEMIMKHRLLTVFLPILLMSCSYFDSDTFTLVCNVNSEWEGNLDGLKGHEKKNETLTFSFKNKKLDLYDCPIWDKERITCSHSPDKSGDERSERLSFDRLSGVVNYEKYFKSSSTKLTEHKTFTGKCEKVKDNKF